MRHRFELWFRVMRMIALLAFLAATGRGWAQDGGAVLTPAHDHFAREVRLEVVELRPKSAQDPPATTIERALLEALASMNVGSSADAKSSLRVELQVTERRNSTDVLKCALVRGRLVESGREFLPAGEAFVERCLTDGPRMATYSKGLPFSPLAATAVLAAELGDRPASRAFSSALAEVMAKLERKLR